MTDYIKNTIKECAAMSSNGHYVGTASSQSSGELTLKINNEGPAQVIQFEGKGRDAILDGTPSGVSYSVCLAVGQGVISVTFNFGHGSGTLTCKLDAEQADALAGRESVLFAFVATARRTYSLRAAVCTSEKTPQLLFRLEFVPSE